jgi:hypothetical protein
MKTLLATLVFVFGCGGVENIPEWIYVTVSPFTSPSIPEWIYEPPNPVPTERVCTEMQEAFDANGAEGVRIWLEPKPSVPTSDGSEYYSKASVIACTIKVARSGK